MAPALSEPLVTVNRVLAAEGIIEGFGHVSAREPGSDEMLISRSIPPETVTEGDILRVSLDGEVLSDPDASTYKEAVVHRAIYRHREDVNAVVHHHAREIMPYAITGKELKPVVPQGVLFKDGIPTFGDYDDEFGRLIATEAEAERMAANLGDATAQFIEGHGANVVGSDLKNTLLRTFSMVQNADRQYQAEQIGEPTFYTEPQASVDAMYDLADSDVSADRIWTYLTNKLDDE